MEDDRMTLEEFGEKSPSEKRQWPRIDIQGHCYIDRSEIMYKIRNIGPGGIRISSPAEFEPGDKFRLQIYLEDGFHFDTLAYVVWCLENPEERPSNYEVGLKFVGLHSEDFKHIKKLIRLKL
jgi:hypothetical protein